MKKFLYHFSNNVIKYLGILITAFLTWYSFRFSEFSDPLDEFERSITVADNIILHLIIIVLLLLTFFLFQRIETKRKNKTSQSKLFYYFPMILSVAWVLLAGFWWISSAIRYPEGDQAFVYDTADYFLKGEYFRLETGGYLSKFPHQLPLVALIQLLFSFVGIANFHACMIINVIATGCIVVACNRTIILFSKENNMSFTTLFFTNLIISLFFPLIFYTSWVYGDILSILFMLISLNCLIAYKKNHRIINLIVLPISMLFAILVRKNSEILLIALIIVCLAEHIKQFDIKLFIAILITTIAPFIATFFINQHYEQISNIKIEEGIPTSGWIYLGLQDKDWKDMYGFYTGERDSIFYECECNSSLADTEYKRYINERLEYLKTNPGELVTFLKKKITQQWNAPLYQSLFFNSRTRSAEEPYSGLLAWIYSNGTGIVFAITNVIQLLVYLGFLLFTCINIKKDSCILKNTAVLFIIGGFMFTCIWEAKARYTFPYLVIMIPFSIIGYQTLINRVNSKKSM